MKHLEFLEKLSDEQIIEMINDYNILHKIEGQLPANSLIKDVCKLISEDYGIPYNLTIGETAFLEEVLKRYSKLIKQ